MVQDALLTYDTFYENNLQVKVFLKAQDSLSPHSYPFGFKPGHIDEYCSRRKLTPTLLYVYIVSVQGHQVFSITKGVPSPGSNTAEPPLLNQECFIEILVTLLEKPSLPPLSSVIWLSLAKPAHVNCSRKEGMSPHDKQVVSHIVKAILYKICVL